jgi:hypothetical protein
VKAAFAACCSASPARPGTRIVGSFDQALLLGLMAQHLIYPGHAPSGADFGEALRRLTKDA